MYRCVTLPTYFYVPVCELFKLSYQETDEIDNGRAAQAILDIKPEDKSNCMGPNIAENSKIIDTWVNILFLEPSHQEPTHISNPEVMRYTLLKLIWSNHLSRNIIKKTTIMHHNVKKGKKNKYAL